MWRAIASNALTLAIVVLLGLAGFIAWAKATFEGPGPLAEAVCVRVERGANLSAVSRTLEMQGAVSDARLFRIGADYMGKAADLRFGSYLVPPGASMAEVLDILTRGGQSTCGAEINLRIGVVEADVVVRDLDPASGAYAEVARFVPGEGPAPAVYEEKRAEDGVRLRVTLAEGVTSWQVVEGLKQADFLAGEVAAVPPEGSLAPDSYEVAAGAERGALLAEMAARQVRIIDSLWETRAPDLPFTTKEEALVLASIIEKETAIAEERGQVAGVFVNRLRAGMPLQTDPTIIYGITRGDMSLRRPIRQSDKAGRTEERMHGKVEYNTYVINGLPPGPIANPGRGSIAAALAPEATDALYFVADGTGGHVFARTLEEHNRNVAKWRAIEAEAEGE
jgi:UPF0755 protein